MITNKEKTDLEKRSRRIIGQIEGVSRMISDQKYCIDIVNQIHAARRALDKLGLIIIENHVKTCVKNKLTSKNGSKNIIEELTQTLDQFLR